MRLTNGLLGMTIVTSPYLTESEERVVTKTRLVERSWFARLFKKPWRWSLKYVEETYQETIIVSKPSPTVYQLNYSTLVMHPETLEKLKEAIRDERGSEPGAGNVRASNLVERGTDGLPYELRAQAQADGDGGWETV